MSEEHFHIDCCRLNGTRIQHFREAVQKLFFRSSPEQKNQHKTNHLTFPAMHGVRQEPVPDTLCAAAGGAVCTTGA